MKFSIQSKLLLSHLSAASKVVNSKNTVTILENFLFKLEGNQLTITCSDLETTLTTSVEVQGAEGGGSFAAKVSTLLDLLKELPDLGLEFDINDDTLEIIIKYLNGRFNLVGVNGDEFPQKAQSEGAVMSFSLPAERLVSGIQHTLFAVSTDQLRPMMTGIFFDIKPDSIIYVSSDTHKLVRYTQKDVKPGFDGSCILPSKPASILSSIFDKNEGSVKVEMDTKSATFTSDEYSMTCRFVNGKYPNYNSVIPQQTSFSLTADRATLLNALRRVSVFADSTSGEVRLQLNNNEIFMSTIDVNFSTSAEEKVQCEYLGDSMVIGFNDNNIIEVLKNINCDSVNIQLLDPLRPGIFLPVEQKENEELLILLVPMRI